MSNENLQSVSECGAEDSSVAEDSGADNAGEAATIPGAAPGKALSPEAVRALRAGHLVPILFVSAMEGKGVTALLREEPGIRRSPTA